MPDDVGGRGGVSGGPRRRPCRHMIGITGGSMGGATSSHGDLAARPGTTRRDSSPRSPVLRVPLLEQGEDMPGAIDGPA